MNTKLLTTVAAATFALLGATGAASAATLVATIDGNDCVGTWATGNGFSTCESPDEYGNSPIIAKFDVEENEWSYNTSIFPSISGDEFTLSIDDDSATWSYVAGLLDPIITVVAIKYSTQFDVWYDGGNAITSGTDWSTLTGAEISHISFYDSTGGGGNFEVPVPAGLPLLLTGLGAFGLFRRRARKSA